MRFLRSCLGLAASLVPLACSMADLSTGGAGGLGGGAPFPLGDATVSFDTPGTLTLTTGATEALGVTAQPASGFSIGFSLIGNTFDASLDQTTVTADPSTGHASVELHAPSMASTFHVRASLLDADGKPGPSAERGVAVSEQGFGAVRVMPLYVGTRPVSTWTASVVAHATCKSLQGTLPAEPLGSLTATAALGSEPLIDNAPAGLPLAVVVRAEHFAWGCTDSAGPTAGDTIDVSVTVIDKLLDLSTASVSVGLTYTPDAPFAALLADMTGTLTDAFLPVGSKDGTVLLDAMEVLVPTASAATFTQRRMSKSWDALANQHFAALSPGIEERVQAWVAAGLVLQAPVIEAGVAAAGKPSHPSVKVVQFGDLDAITAGVVPGVFTWSAQPNDSVLLAGKLAWAPSRFAAAAALPAAQQDFPQATTVAAALTSAVDCQGLATALGSFGTCDVACVAQLCGVAVTARWNGASTMGPAGWVDIEASAAATVGDAAQPTALAGHWVGTFSDGTLAVMVNGDLTGTTP